MNTFQCSLMTVRFFFVWLLVILTGGASTFAQTAGFDYVPVVTVQAIQPIATSTDSGVFTVFRKGNTNLTLNVWYDLTGTASNGVDYTLIPPHLVTIDAGAISNSIAITPLTNAPPSGSAKTVVLTLTNSPLMTPINYGIGSPSRAVVYVKAGGATNLPPGVGIVIPTNGAVFFVDTNVKTDIELLAKASDPDGSISNVEFFAGTNDLGPGSPVVLDPPGINGVTGLVYFIYWRNPFPGNYALTAEATDDGGASTTSDAVSVTIQPAPPPATNSPLVLRIVSPANGSVFRAPINLPLFAYFNDSHEAFNWESVEFYDGTNFLGVAHPVPMPPTALSTNIYELVWTNAPVGHHVLIAQAEFGNLLNNAVGRIISDPVNITILPFLPPPTNRPPMMSIVATDPVAVEGTNDWVWQGETNVTPTWAAWSGAVCRCFTNYGPQTATFTVHRHGNTNDDVTVAYDIGGTASNGVDYVALPGKVTVPAGSRRALITIVPIDDGPPDLNKTVILTLVPTTNAPPDYMLGWPRRAAAIILDGTGPRPPSSVLPDKCFHLTLPGPDAAWFCIQYSTNLIDWTSVCTNQVVHGSIDFVDPDAVESSARFYRAVPLAEGP